MFEVAQKFLTSVLEPNVAADYVQVKCLNYKLANQQEDNLYLIENLQDTGTASSAEIRI